MWQINEPHVSDGDGKEVIWRVDRLISADEDVSLKHVAWEVRAERIDTFSSAVADNTGVAMQREVVAIDEAGMPPAAAPCSTGITLSPTRGVDDGRIRFLKARFRRRG